MNATLKKLDEIFFISEIIKSRKMAAMLALGFSAGLPIMLVFTTLSFWLRDVGVSRSAIGFFVWVGFAYSLKFLWAPLTDRIRIPVLSRFLGNRLAWTAVAIFGTSLSMVFMGLQDPAQNLAAVARCAVAIAFFSATLDICVDAWRIDVSDDEEQAMMAATYQLGYRFGMILAVSGVLWVAELSSWQTGYWCAAAAALIGASTPFWATPPPKPSEADTAPTNWTALIIGVAVLSALVIQLQKGAALREAIAAFGTSLASHSEVVRILLPLLMGLIILFIPFAFTVFLMTTGRGALDKPRVYDLPIVGDFTDIVRRFGWLTVLILIIVMSYRISDYTMGVMAMPLYSDLGYSKGTVGIVKGAFGIPMLMLGAFGMAWSSLKYGLSNTLIAGAVLTILTNLAFAWLSQIEQPLAISLFVTIGADNVAAGFAGTALIAFMSTLTDKKFTATQYALFSSLVAFSGKFLAGFSGVLADKIGYYDFFFVTAMFGLPALAAVLLAWKLGFIADGRAAAQHDS